MNYLTDALTKDYDATHVVIMEFMVGQIRVVAALSGPGAKLKRPNWKATIFATTDYPNKREGEVYRSRNYTHRRPATTDRDVAATWLTTEVLGQLRRWCRPASLSLVANTSSMG